MSINKAALALCSLAAATGIAFAAVDNQSGNIEAAPAHRVAPASQGPSDTPASVASLR